MSNEATVRPCHGCGAWLIERMPGADADDVLYRDERVDHCPRCGTEWYPVANLVRAGDVLLKDGIIVKRGGYVKVIGIDRFGLSAPGGTAMKELGKPAEGVEDPVGNEPGQAEPEAGG